MAKRKTIAEDFWSNADVRGANECWLWQRGTAGDGYGQLTINQRKVFAHRHAYELTNGAIPDGAFVCHRCDTPSCINPAHLWIGTPTQNNHDMISKGRYRMPAVRSKHNAKITEQDAIDIRSKYASGVLMRVIAAEYGISRSAVGNIVHHLTWKTKTTQGDAYNESEAQIATQLGCTLSVARVVYRLILQLDEAQRRLDEHAYRTLNAARLTDFLVTVQEAR